MSRLRVYWPHNQVTFNGKSISDAWAEEMNDLGFECIHGSEEALTCDFAFFISDSMLDEKNAKIIGKIPTLCYFWGWQPERMVTLPDWHEQARQKLELMSRCTRIIVPGLLTYYQLCDFGLASQLCMPGIDARTFDRYMPKGPIAKRNQVAFLSRLAPHKGLEMLLQGLSMLDGQVALIAMGPGDKEGYIKMAEALRVPVEFCEPNDEDKVRILAESALLVHPSSYEGFGLPPLEALYCGTPVLALDIPQMRWLLQEDAYYASTPEGIARNVADIFNNYPEAQGRAQKARQRIGSSLTLKGAGQRLWAHIHQAHKEFWGRKVKADSGNKDLVKRAYEAEHRRNWAYGMADFDVSAPFRFDPTWSRHWRAQHFIAALKESGASKILDLGCGAVYPTILARAGFEVTGVDVSEEALRQAQELAQKWGVADRITTQQGYAQHLDFADGHFDAAVLGEILEHVGDPDVVLKEAMRVVKPGGRLIASTPCGHHHYDPYHIASADGGWDDARINWLLAPWQKELVKVDKIAEEGTDPSCYFMVLDKH